LFTCIHIHFLTHALEDDTSLCLPCTGVHAWWWRRSFNTCNPTACLSGVYLF
jgi:hypothetical protein